MDYSRAGWLSDMKSYRCLGGIVVRVHNKRSERRVMKENLLRLHALLCILVAFLCGPCMNLSQTTLVL